MSDAGDPGVGAGRDADGDADASLDFEEGRYVYCAVLADGDATFSADGIEGGQVGCHVRDGVGAIVQPVDSVYDSDDVTQVRSWLLDHQQVVDDAGQRFGTPLPFRFDTILKGDDAAVQGWLADHHDELMDALEWLAGRWEYRIRLEWDEASIADAVLEADDDLRELAERAESADEGTGFLLEKQYRQQLSERLEGERTAIEEQLYDELERHAVEIGRAGGASVLDEDEEEGGMETVADLSLLAEADREEAIGEVLERYAAEDAYEVSYTGPWPPYSFAPEIGTGEADGDNGRGSTDAADDGGSDDPGGAREP